MTSFADEPLPHYQIMKLRPVRLDGKPMDLETSFKRNWMFGLGPLYIILLFIPVFGWLALFAIFIINILEVVLVFLDPEGRRLGDRLAGTKVIEVSE